MVASHASLVFTRPCAVVVEVEPVPRREEAARAHAVAMTGGGSTLTAHPNHPLSSWRAALRRVSELVPDARPATSSDTPLERLPGDADPPLLMDADLVEDATVRAHAVPGAPEAGIAAFLDGAQTSRVLAWSGPAPIVHGTVAAAIRRRVNRRLITWEAPRVERRVYVPLGHAPEAALRRAFPGDRLVDTAPPGPDGTLPPRHPALLLERARNAVSRARETLERELAERWCAVGDGPLLIDGGIGTSERVAGSPAAVGVVKSHRTLYADGPALDVVLALAAGERSSVVRIAPRDRAPVWSWYLRLRDPATRGVLWGLVRVEVSASAHEDPRARAHAVSRWLLAERAPLSAPDPRWDTMVYGVRDVEQYLRALTAP